MNLPSTLARHATLLTIALASFSTGAAPVSMLAALPTAQRWTPHALATNQFESSPTFSPDGREVYFMRADRNFDNYRLLYSRCAGGHWTSSVEVPFAGPPHALEADPFMSRDGRRLFFVSTRHDAQREDLDIWVVDRIADDGWGQPRRLPAPVNSGQPELLPRELADGRLYFGSSRADGQGQGDIYVATPSPDGHWNVSNVGPPVSTAANEYEADISRDGRQLVVVADRGDRSHLYRFVLRDGRWSEVGRVPANERVFQVGPLLSPDGRRLLFAQADGGRAGEWFLIDLVPDADQAWPPICDNGRARGR